MPEIESRFIPMPEANTRRIRTLATLPFKLEKQVGLDTKYIERLMQIGGINTLRILSDHEGERSSTSAQVVGLGSDGSAIAGKCISTTISISSGKLSNNYMTRYCKQASWTHLDITLNINTNGLQVAVSPSVPQDDEDVHWAIPSFKSDQKISFGKKVE